MAAALGYEVAIFLRSGSEIRALADHQPFPAKVLKASKGKLQVMMFSERVGTRARKAVLAHATDADKLAFGERELYWLPSAGTQGSALDVRAIDRLLGATTMRTKGTIEQLAAKYLAEH